MLRVMENAKRLPSLKLLIFTATCLKTNKISLSKMHPPKSICKVMRIHPFLGSKVVRNDPWLKISCQKKKKRRVFLSQIQRILRKSSENPKNLQESPKAAKSKSPNPKLTAICFLPMVPTMAACSSLGSVSSAGGGSPGLRG